MDIPSNQRVVSDTRVTVETPEGADLPLDLAGIWVRIAAFLIDFLIRVAVVLGFSFVAAGLGGAGSGLFLILYFAMEWFYPVAFEVWQNGQTPGKKSMGIAVVNDDGTPVTFSGSLLRNLLRVVDFLPAFYVSGIIASVLNPQFKRLGDLAAGTIVVYCHAKSVVPLIDAAEKKPMPIDFTTDEQRALLNFAERSKTLSPERQHELAAILAPVIGHDDTVDLIKKMANSAMGGR